ncbi:ComEA family DNA-binding protein [Blastococcus saxobsidens]|uniref:Competence protein ComEA-like protein with helix-hairpin-helix repeat region n=1 Tax=Blastococcus saxobsidens (strain DD2) TaxID=1146883 RepID=H6RLH0_BLASD|nr:helix-hairpin-helix domain-containing protein [Blastococcus saxobsidens]CCG02496.1 Competence protein ComEA-like protein with helix-hairpin-helix repeat region [Blastococcus saxobsidens DD2]
MRLTTRRGDDADIIRARLRALLAEEAPVGGWLPEEQPDEGWPTPSAPAEERSPLPDGLAGEDDGLPQGVGRHRAPGVAVRWGAGPSGSRALWVAAVATILVVLGWTWLERPRVEPAAAASDAAGASARVPASPSAPPGEAPSTPPTVVVSVVGEVARPGLVTLAAGARVADAVAAAGGLLPDADPASVNLAAPVTDGQQIPVGAPAAAAPVGGAGGPAGGGPAGPVDLNTAGMADLDALPGIGPVLAQRIVDHRTRHGPFRTVEELDEVPGIGPAIAAELAELVAV